MFNSIPVDYDGDVTRPDCNGEGTDWLANKCRTRYGRGSRGPKTKKEAEERLAIDAL